MKIKVKEYSDEKNDYIYEERNVVARYRYLKDGDELSCIKGKIYNCVGYDDGMLAIVDETGEAYLYCVDDFELLDKNLYNELDKVKIISTGEIGTIVDIYRSDDKWVYQVELDIKTIGRDIVECFEECIENIL